MKKFDKFTYIVFIVIAIIIIRLVIALGSFYITGKKDDTSKNEIQEPQSTISGYGEDSYVPVQESVVEIDITNKLKEHWYSGIITKIEGNFIFFDDDDENKKYVLQVKDSYKYGSLRTSENIEFKDIKVGDYIDTFSYYNDDIFGIATNITGETLKKELLESMALGEANISGIASCPNIIDIDIQSSEKAILTLEIYDVYREAFKNEESFEIKVLVNSKTKISSKSGAAHSVETLNNAAHDIVIIYLDKNTLNDEYPVATVFDSSDS